MSEPEPTARPKAAFIAAESRDWVAYYDAVAGKPPRETLLMALGRFDAESAASAVRGSEWPLAVDLGAGEGRDTAELLRRGWRVIAIDDHPDGLRRLRERRDAEVASALADGRLEIRRAGFCGVELPRCDLVNASFSLPFCHPEGFAELWRKITAALGPGGRFAGQLFGDRDSWATIEDRTHLNRADAIGLFEGFVLEHFQEEDRPGQDAQSHHKHWHVFHVVAKKR